MAFPKKNSLTYKLCELIYKQGDMTDYELRVMAASVGCTQFHSPSYMVKEYILRSGDTMTLRHLVRKQFDELTGSNSNACLMPLPRQATPFKPMTGYTAQLLAGKRDGIREMSFYRTFASALPR